MTTNFTITNLPENRLVTEGGSLSLTLSPSGGFTGTIIWKVLFDGKRPATFGDFAALTGTLDFSDGTEQTATITSTANAALLGDRGFQVQFYHQASDGTLTAEGDGHSFTLQDQMDDVANLPSERVSITSGADIFVLGSHNTYIDNTTGGGGDDLIIITRHQTQNLTLEDDSGNNILKFDHDVVITQIVEERFLGQLFGVNITLGTGAMITIGSPDADISSGGKQYQYQIGDGIVMDYHDFVASLGTPTEAEPFTVVPVTDTPVLDPVVDTLPSERVSITSGADIFVLGSHNTYIDNTTGGGGNDLFIITRHQTQNLTLEDDSGNNILKFDHDVVITQIVEERFLGQLFGVDITLGTGAVITIGSPDADISSGGKRYQYQIGDGIVMDYQDFIASLGTPTPEAPFIVTRTGEDQDPLFEVDSYLTYDGSFKAFNVSDFGNTDPTPTSTSPDLAVANLLYLDGESILPHSNDTETVNLGGGDDIYLVTGAYFTAQNPDAILDFIDNDGDNIILLDNNLQIEEVTHFSSSFDINLGQLPPETSVKVSYVGDDSIDYYLNIKGPSFYKLYHEGAGNDSLFDVVDYTEIDLLTDFQAEMI